MELLREETQKQVSNAELEAQKHNAMISERYKRLQNAVANQFAEDIYTEENKTENVYGNVNAPEKTTYISPNTVNSTTYAQTPTVTEYISRASSALFTTEKFDRMQSVQEEQAVADVAVAPSVTVASPVQMTATKTEAQYSLSSMAKMVIAAFSVVIVGMLTLICVNTHTINQKQLRIQELEQRKAELVEQNEAIQRRIENAQSEETIREYAESQGMVQKGN